MKHGVITITVKGSPSSVNSDTHSLMKVIRETSLRLNHGSEIQQSLTNLDDPKELKVMMGQLLDWTLPPRVTTVPDGRPRGFWNRFAKEVGSIFTAEPFEDDAE